MQRGRPVIDGGALFYYPALRGFLHDLRFDFRLRVSRGVDRCHYGIEEDQAARFAERCFAVQDVPEDILLHGSITVALAKGAKHIG